MRIRFRCDLYYDEASGEVTISTEYAPRATMNVVIAPVDDTEELEGWLTQVLCGIRKTIMRIASGENVVSDQPTRVNEPWSGDRLKLLDGGKNK